MEIENSNQDAVSDVISSLGVIYGVAEIRGTNAEHLIGTPVLVAENAFVFFAWDEASKC